MPCISSRSSVTNIINQQQHKLKKEMSCIVQQLATQSKYSSLSRQDKRIAEYNRMRVTQEQSLQKDTKKAERLSSAIGKLLDQLLGDFTEIKQILNSYNFASTIGSDSGSDVGDLSTATDTRKAWQMQLINKLTMVYQMVDAQKLGDYTLLHQPESAYDVTSSASSTSTTMFLKKCPNVYRPVFHYFAPSGDCLVISTEAGGHSGDPSTVTSSTTNYAGTVSGNFNGQTGDDLINIRSCVLGYKSGAVSPTAEGKKFAPQTFNHFQVTNKDLEIRQLWRLLVGSNDGETVHAAAWWSFLVANSFDAVNNKGVTADAAGLKTHFETEISLPATMSTELNTTTDAATEDSVYAALAKLVDGDDATTPIDATITVDAHPQSDGDHTTTQYTAALAHAPTVMHIEDESDMQFVIRLVCCVTDEIRACQINNDREHSVIGYVEEVSQNNQAYYQDVLTDMTAIDESELRQRFTVGKELCSDLDELHKENCCAKGNFFSDPTRVGGYGCR